VKAIKDVGFIGGSPLPDRVDGTIIVDFALNGSKRYCPEKALLPRIGIVVACLSVSILRQRLDFGQAIEKRDVSIRRPHQNVTTLVSRVSQTAADRRAKKSHRSAKTESPSPVIRHFGRSHRRRLKTKSHLTQVG
jgi:hypothetical protein